jgi:hypothetical protein
MSAWCVRLFWCCEQQAKMAITHDVKLDSQSGGAAMQAFAM